MIGKRPTPLIIVQEIVGLPQFLPWEKDTITIITSFSGITETELNHWQLDPSKWIIWTLSKIGLTSELKRVPQERILLAETKETKKQLNTQISLFQDSIAESANELVEQALSSLEGLSERLSEITSELQTAAQTKINLSKSKIHELHKEVRAMLQEIESTGKLATA